MTPEIIIALSIFVLAFVSFIINKIPSGLTAVIAALVMTATGIITPSEFVSSFGTDTVIMVASCIILGNAMFETGAANTVGEFLISRSSKTENRLLMVLILVSGILSAFLSNTAVVAMFIPLLAATSAKSGGAITQKDTYMAVGIASVVGGVCTLAGSTPQMVAQGILTASDGVRTLTFWELGKIGVPMLVLLVLYYAIIGEPIQRRIFRDDGHKLTEAEVFHHVDKPKSKQIIMLVLLIACVIGFSTGILTLGLVAACAAAICMITGCISFERAFETMDWNTVMMLAGATAISAGLNNSGLIHFAAGGITQAFGGDSASPVILLSVILVLCSVLSNFMSNTASTAALVPLSISVAQGLSVDPIPFVIAVIIGSNLAFSTPISTPPITMTMTAGYRFKDYTIVGGLFNLLSLIVACILIPILYPF